MYPDYIRAAARAMAENMDSSEMPLYGESLRLPDRKAIISLIKEIRRLMFPAYYGDTSLMTLPAEEYAVPILLQLFLVEFAVDGLKLASMNTPDMLANSLSVVGGLILGDFAVDIGWLMPEVILYMAFVAIANFTQRSYELGYAFKFMRMLLLLLTALFDVWGFFGGLLLITILLATNKTANGNRSYLYPLIPFNGRALASLVFRVKKKDFEK